MFFKDIIGQTGTKQQLVEMVAHNRLSHALFFLGKEGTGALPLALAFAQYVSLLPRGQEATADLFGAPVEKHIPLSLTDADNWMQQQPSFSKAAQLVHPDIHFSYPVITKKPGAQPLSSDYISEWRAFIGQHPYGNVYDWLQYIGADNKQGNISSAECNDILRKLSLKSFENGYKILVMWMPEYLGKEGNKLLKVIEEPPPDTLFILVAENENEVLSTILSRCQLIRVPLLEPESIENFLVAKNACTSEQSRLIANASEGNYREALHLLAHADEDFHGLLRDWLNATLKNQTVPLIKLIEEIGRLGREKQKQFLRHFTHLIEQAVRQEVSGEAKLQNFKEVLSESEKDFTGKLNKVMRLEQKEAIALELDRATYHIERNANAKLLFHALSIKIYHIVKNSSIIV